MKHVEVTLSQVGVLPELVALVTRLGYDHNVVTAVSWENGQLTVATIKNVTHPRTKPVLNAEELKKDV